MKILSLVVAKNVRELCRQYEVQVGIEGVATALDLMSQECGGSVSDAHKIIDTVNNAVSLSDKIVSSPPPPIR